MLPPWLVHLLVLRGHADGRVPSSAAGAGGGRLSYGRGLLPDSVGASGHVFPDTGGLSGEEGVPLAGLHASPQHLEHAAGPGTQSRPVASARTAPRGLHPAVSLVPLSRAARAPGGWGGLSRQAGTLPSATSDNTHVAVFLPYLHHMPFSSGGFQAAMLSMAGDQRCRCLLAEALLEPAPPLARPSGL